MRISLRTQGIIFVLLGIILAAWSITYPDNQTYPASFFVLLSFLFCLLCMLAGVIQFARSLD